MLNCIWQAASGQADGKPFERGGRGVREPDRRSLAGIEEPLQVTGRLLDRHGWVGGMEVEQIEPIRAETGEALVDLGPESSGPPVDHLPPRWSGRGTAPSVDAALAGDHHSVAAARRRRRGSPARSRRARRSSSAVSRCVMPPSIAAWMVATATSRLMPSLVIPAIGRQQPRPSGPTATGDVPGSGGKVHRREGSGWI
jgi:hypothetical protein